MAKHNHVFLYGQVNTMPTIYRNDETGEYKRGICPILVIRGIRGFGNKTDKIKYDNPVIMSGNPEIVEIMSKFRVGDMIEVKGSITTKNVIKSKTCDFCKTKNNKNGTVVFINPIFLSLTEKGLSAADGSEKLKERSEISNSIMTIGTLCNDPLVFKTERGGLIATYQIAVNRKYRIQEDATEIRTDFPWVKSYGRIAANDAVSLHKGSLVFVDGFLQTRTIQKNVVCEHCGETFKWPDSSMDIVPYSTEYLRDFYSQEEIAENASADAKEAVLNIFKDAQQISSEADMERADASAAYNEEEERKLEDIKEKIFK